MKTLATWLLIIAPGLAVLTGCKNPLSGDKPGTETSIAFRPGLASGVVPDRLLIESGLGQSAPTGAPITIAVRVIDSAGAKVPNTTLTLSILSGGGSVETTATTNELGLASITWTLGGSAGTQTMRIAGTGFTGSPSTLDVSANAIATTLSAANSSITGTSTTVANGTATSTVTITIRDASNFGVAGFIPTFSATGLNNSYSTCSMTNASGVSTCTMTSTRAEVKTLSIVTPVAKSDGNVTFVHGPASALVFTTQPAGGVIEGANLSAQPVVEVRDANGNTVTSGADATSSITLSLSSGTGALGGTLTRTATAGIATFSGLSVDTAGTGKVITATKADTTGSGGTATIAQPSNAFTINVPAPGAFTISSAVAGATSVVLTWGASSNAASYTVRYGTSSGTYATLVSNSATSPLTISGLTAGTTYYFMVTAVNATGSRDATAEASATALTTFTITSAAVITGNSIRVTWPAVTGATSYNVSYGTATGTYGTVATNATSPYDIGSLTGGQAYYIMVTATNSSGSVNANAEVSATAISAFTVASYTPDVLSASIAWNAATGATAYDVLYDTSSHTAAQTYASTVASAASPAAISPLTSGTTYYFRVRARNSSGSVISTNELSGIPYHAFTLNIPFTAGTESSYFFNDTTYASTMGIQLNGGLVRLKALDQTDNSSTQFTSPYLNSLQWDSTYVRLNSTTNIAELDASWTPHWSDLAAYWKMDGDWVSTSTTSHTGTAGTGASTDNSITRIGTHTGLFDGTAAAYVTVPDADDLDNTANLSILFWVYLDPATTCAADGNRAILGKRVANGNQEAYNVFVLSCVLNVDIDGSGNRIASATLAKGQWYHIAITYDGTNTDITQRVNIYVNGAHTTVGTENSASIPNYTSALLIGNTGGSTPLRGRLDDVAIFRATLSGSDVDVIYGRQFAKYTGMLTSRVFDAYDTDLSWTSLRASTTFPFYKELPPASASEVTTDYSSIPTTSTTNPGLSSGLVGYWKLNEPAGTTSLASSHGGTFTMTVNGGGTMGAKAKFNTGVSLVRASSQYLSTASVDVTNTFTFSMWVRPGVTSVETQMLVVNGNSGLASDGFRLFVNSWNTNDGKVNFETGNGTTGAIAQTAAGVIRNLQWQHVVLTVDRVGGIAKIYVNGDLSNASSTAARTDFTRTGVLNFGRAANNNNYINGRLDEIMMYNRILNSDEVVQLYRRGANRIKYQVRTCATAACTAEEATVGKGWRGPSNSSDSYFSELNNNAVPKAMTGAVSATPLTVAVADYTGLDALLNPKRYFQYRAIFESDDANTLCSYGTCSPELKSITIGPDHYRKEQTITSKTSSDSSFNTIDTNGFSLQAPTGTCNGTSSGTSSVAKFAISHNGTNFYYWNTTNSAWEASTSYATASTAANITANIATFPSIGTGSLQIKTYLKSDGLTPCSVGPLRVTGKSF